jgi:hypothetical protein
MGAQFADLPRVSTASQEIGAQQQQVRMQQFDQIGRAVDRMTAYFQDVAVTQAEKEARKYAIENPLTKEHIDFATSTGIGLQVKGAGGAFQRVYEETQAQLLSSELQLEGQRQIANFAAQIKAGANVDPENVRLQLKDLVDGYSSTLLALDPKESIRLRSALTVAGNQVYKEANDRQLLLQREFADAKYANEVKNAAPLIETYLKQAGSIDPTTQQPINVDALIEVHRKPFLGSVFVTGSSKHLEAFNKMVADAKIDALSSLSTSPEFATTAGQAFAKVEKGDFGNMSSVYKGLTDTDKKIVIDRTLKRYSNAEAARKIDQANLDLLNREKGNTLSIELLNPKTTTARRREIVNTLISINQMTFEQGDAALKPKGATDNPQLETSLYQQIRNGQITTLGQLSPFASGLSNRQYESLGRSIADIQYRNAVENLTLAAGITDNMANPGAERVAQKEGYLRQFQKILSTPVKNEQGVLVYPEPAAAAEAAKKAYNSDKTVTEKQTTRENAKAAISRTLQAKGIAMPAVPVEQIDVNTLRGLTPVERERIQMQIKTFKDNL